jgi:hypothetical protein
MCLLPFLSTSLLLNFIAFFVFTCMYLYPGDGEKKILLVEMNMLTMLANLISDYESESLGPMYGLIRQVVSHVATSTLPWAVQLRNSYDTISNMGGFSESDLVVLTNTLDKDLSDSDEPDFELMVSPVNNAVALATHMTCLQLPTFDALTCSGDSATLNGSFRAFFVPEPTLSSWRFADLPHRTI